MCQYQEIKHFYSFCSDINFINRRVGSEEFPSEWYDCRHRRTKIFDDGRKQSMAVVQGVRRWDDDRARGIYYL